MSTVPLLVNPQSTELWQLEALLEWDSICPNTGLHRVSSAVGYHYFLDRGAQATQKEDDGQLTAPWDSGLKTRRST